MELADQLWNDLRQACPGAWRRGMGPNQAGEQFALQGIATVHIHDADNIMVHAKGKTTRFRGIKTAVAFVKRLQDREERETPMVDQIHGEDDVGEGAASQRVYTEQGLLAEHTVAIRDIWQTFRDIRAVIAGQAEALSRHEETNNAQGELLSQHCTAIRDIRERLDGLTDELARVNTMREQHHRQLEEQANINRVLLHRIKALEQQKAAKSIRISWE